MRIGTAALWVALAGVSNLTAANAQTQNSTPRMAQASPAVADEASTARPVRRPPARLRVYPSYQTGSDGVYPRYFPGSNAVRVCNVSYVQEFRPSGTVIAPHMHCVWRPG